jgi:1-deoxy-D-xylulose-5-phosphate reductoisomerase
LNAANEEAVAAFLDHRLSYPGIASTLESVLSQHADQTANSLEDLTAADDLARVTARQLIKQQAG